MSGYLPNRDSDFDTWLTNYASYAGAHMAELGLTADDIAALNASQIQWSTDFVAASSSHTIWKHDVAQKNDSRKATETLVRSQVARIQANPTTTNADRESLGITVRGAGTSGVEMPLLDTPDADININERLAHNVTVYTRTSDGPRKGKPAGSLGCEVHRYIGQNPVSPPEMQLVGLMTKSSFRLQYSPEDANKTVHYAMRWIRKDGTPGAWSETESATIAA